MWSRIADTRVSYNKISTASLSWIILVFLTINLGTEPNKLAGMISEGTPLIQRSINVNAVYLLPGEAALPQKGQREISVLRIFMTAEEAVL